MRANAARRWLAGGAACTGLFMGAFSFAQAPLKTTLPASAPTTFVPPASSISSTPQRGPDPAQRARVQVSGRTLQITAEDSSLNQILRDIARDTGMKVTGGVADERVYGVYGPADISAVLTRLFDGMGTNMLLVEDARQQPTELILTPQHGGVTPGGGTRMTLWIFRHHCSRMCRRLRQLRAGRSGLLRLRRAALPWLVQETRQERTRVTYPPPLQTQVYRRRPYSLRMG
jgi:hypothetical protein